MGAPVRKLQVMSLTEAAASRVRDIMANASEPVLGVRVPLLYPQRDVRVGVTTADRTCSLREDVARGSAIRMTSRASRRFAFPHN